jgi:hypothetical protein
MNRWYQHLEAGLLIARSFNYSISIEVDSKGNILIKEETVSSML